MKIILGDSYPAIDEYAWNEGEQIKYIIAVKYENNTYWGNAIGVSYIMPASSGCTDPEAINYDSEATNNDGSCYHYIVTDIDGNEYQAVILSLDSRNMRVELEPHALEWNIPIEILNDDRYFFDPERLFLSGKRQGRLIRMGQRLKLKLLRVDVIQRKLDFGFEDWLN